MTLDSQEEFHLPKNIKKDYFDLVKLLVGENEILWDYDWADADKLINKDERYPIMFFDGFFNGSVPGHAIPKICLGYYPNEIDLEISALSFNKNGDKSPIEELGLISTTEKNFRLETDVLVGKNFKYHGGSFTSHIISNVINYIQKSSVIPHIPKEKFLKITGA